MREIRLNQQRVLDEIEAKLIECSTAASAASMDSVAEAIRHARLTIESTQRKVAYDLEVYAQREATL